MSCDEQYWRCPTRAAIDSLSTRFGLPNDLGMQDWEFEVADEARIEEFLLALESSELTDDEQFTLSQTVMQCFETLASEGLDVAAREEWHRFVLHLRSRPSLFAYTLCYWAALDQSDLEDGWYISELVRPLWTELEPKVAKAG